MADRIDATLDVVIAHRAGPVVADPGHVLAWTCADGAWLEGRRNGFTFEVCPRHSDPDVCHPDCDAEKSDYYADIVSADLGEVS